jgi:hypothetical protein
MDKVIVTADAAGCVIGIAPKNPEFGYIRVQQTRPIITDWGWVKLKTLSALIKGSIADLKALNFRSGQELPGKIVVREQTLPFDNNNTDKNIKIAGTCGIQCRYYDELIYRDTFYTTNLAAEDQLIPHTNNDEIREAQVRLKLKGSGVDLHKMMIKEREAVL